MKKIIKIQKQNQKIEVNKRGNVATMPKHIARRPFLQHLEKRTPRSDVIALTEDSLIRSKQPATSLVRLFLAAGKILPKKEAALLPLIRKVPKTRGHTSVSGIPDNNHTPRHRIIAACHVIPSDEPNAKTSEPSASVHWPIHRTLDKELCMLDHPSTTSGGIHWSNEFLKQLSERRATNTVKGGRPIPPPPRLPRVPIGFAYSSGTLPSISTTSSPNTSNVSKR